MYYSYILVLFSFSICFHEMYCISTFVLFLVPSVDNNNNNYYYYYHEGGE